MPDVIPDEILRRLAWHGITPPKKPGSRKTLCPKCSSTREHKTRPCLSIYAKSKIRDLYVKCHHCGYEESIQ